MTRSSRRRALGRLTVVVAVYMLLAGGAAVSHADGVPVSRAGTSAAYRAECGTCHVAFAPGLLGASSWSRVMNDLPHHYGVDASVEAATVKTLAAWLASHAASSGREEPPGHRITLSRWFINQHREVPANAWSRPSIKSAANCAACHANAAEGDFNEERVRIPR